MPVFAHTCVQALSTAGLWHQAPSLVVLHFIFIYWFIVSVAVVPESTVEVKGPLCGVGSLLQPLYGFQGSNSGCQTSAASSFTKLSHFPAQPPPFFLRYALSLNLEIPDSTVPAWPESPRGPLFFPPQHQGYSINTQSIHSIRCCAQLFYMVSGK